MARYYFFEAAMHGRKHDRKLQRRHIRDMANPFEMPDEEFRHIYRVRKEMVLYICDELEVDLRPQNNDGLPVYIKVLTSLHLLADGNYQRGTGQDHGLSIAQSTVSKYLSLFTQAVIRRLMGKWIIFPGSDMRRRTTSEGFMATFGVPNILGAIDCTHIKIFPPPQQEQKIQYKNRHGFYSINVQIVADSECRILGVNARYPGRVHDSFIFNYSNVKEEMRRLHEGRIGDYFLLGDSGYALEPWLMTPVLNAAPNSPEGRYTEWHCRARNVVERTNGYIKNVFRCTGHDRALHYETVKAAEIINTCCVLYNIMHHFRSSIMFWILVGVGIVYYIWKAFAGDDPLDKLPGPKQWPIIGNTFFFSRMTHEKYFACVREFVQAYGDRFVFKVFQTRVLNICAAKDAEAILSHSRNITKSKHYSFVEPWLGTGLLLSTGSKWHKRRKLLTPSFHFNILKNFAVVMEDRSRAFVRQLQGSKGAVVEVSSLIKDFTLYTICETAMGISLDLDKSKPALDYLDAVINIGPLILERNLSFWMQLDLVYYLLPSGKLHEKYLKTIHSFADNVIHGRKQQRLKDLEEFETLEEDGVKRKLAFLDLLLEVESKGEIDLEGIREEVNTFMFEGHDTTANALTFGIMLLADHPEVQDKIREEYRRITSGSSRPFSMSDFTDMKYLDAVIKETLRLYPSVPFIGRTITEDLMLDNVTVRAGTQVAVRIYDLQRREDLFPSPHQFKPERFLEPEHRPYAFVPFSAGPRNCIGQRFAMMEMKCVLSMICENFRIEPRIPNHRPALAADLVLRATEPIYVRFVPR